MADPAYHEDDDEPGVFDIADDAADEAATRRGLADAGAGPGG